MSNRPPDALANVVGEVTAGAVTTVAADYLDSLTIDQRRANGAVYTPHHLVDFVLEYAGYITDAAIDTRTVLDPACGGGAFLERAVFAVAIRLRVLGHDFATTPGRRVLLETVETRLHGVDLDPHACRLARAAVRRALLSLAPGYLAEGYFAANVRHADFLIDPAVDTFGPVSGGFDYIVGNPPYVSATRIHAGYKRLLRRRFATAGGRLDLYTVFVERSLALLSKGGRLALITPDKFLTSQTGSSLRDFIVKQSSVRTIAQFQSDKVFRDAATVPCVLVLERDGASCDVQVLQCGDRPSKNGRVVILSRSTFPQDHLSHRPWQLRSPSLMEFARRLQAGHPTLSNRTVRISAGPATGRDGLYVLPEDSDVEIEPDLLRPAVRGRDVGPYRIENPRLNVLVPYVFTRSGEPSLIGLSAFPKARRYLERHRAELEQRHCVRVWGKRWYDLHDQVLIDLAKQGKILVPDIANFNRFAVDRGRFFPLHSTYYLIPNPDVDPDFLTGILNSTVNEFLIRLLAPVVKNGFSRYRRQFLATLPIPDVAPALKARVSAASRAGDSAGANRLAAQIFGLSDLDQTLIQEFLAEKDTLNFA